MKAKRQPHIFLPVSPSPPCVGSNRNYNIPDSFENVNCFEKKIFSSIHQYPLLRLKLTFVLMLINSAQTACG